VSAVAPGGGSASATASAAAAANVRSPRSFHERTSRRTRSSYATAARAEANARRRPEHSRHLATGHAVGAPQRSQSGGPRRGRASRQARHSCSPAASQTTQRTGRIRSRSLTSHHTHLPVPLQVMLSSFWVASTKPGAALVRRQGWLPWQGRGWFLAPCDRGPEAGVRRLEGHRRSVETKASRVGDGFVTNVCRIQPGDEKARSASASVSLEPTSNHRPGTRQAYTGTRGYSHSTNSPGWSGLFPPSRYSRTRPNDERG
jgi:hypothetical protein